MADPFRSPTPWRAFAGLALAGALVAGLLIWRGVAARMPGERFEGPAPVTAAERQAAASLRRDVEALVALGERSARRPDALRRGRDLIVARLTEIGLEPRLDGYEVDGARFDNVVAGAEEGGLMIGAHYDSAPGSPGGNDDASGVAAVLALAERLREEPGARFALFVNEEPPRFRTADMGSRVLAHRLARQRRLPDAMIALDSLGCYRGEEGSQRYATFAQSVAFGTRGDFVAFVGDELSEALLRSAVERFREVARIPSEGAVLSRAVQGAGWSDHESFWLQGVPAILVTDTAAFRDDAYHTPRDDGSQIDYVALARVVDGLEAVARARLSGSP